MADLISAWEDAFPVYVSGGIASSGAAKPNKKLVNKLGQVIADAIADGGGGGGGDPALTIRVNALEAIDSEDRLEALEGEADTMAAYRREMTERPGDAPELFTDAYTGSPDASAGTTLSPVTVANGKVIQLPGAHVLARRGWFRIEPDRRYLVRGVVQRVTNPADPLGDAVELGIAWFKNDGTQVSGTPISVLATFSSLTVVSGRTEKQAIVALASGDDVTNVAPATTVYGRVYLRSYGTDGLTNIEVLSVKDVTDAIGDSIAQSLVDDAIAAVADVQAAETIVAGYRNDAVNAAASAGADLWSRPVTSIVSTEPGSPSVGDRVLLDATNGTHPNQVAEYFTGAWHYSGAPRSGQTLKVGLHTYRYTSAWALAPYVVSADDYGGDANAAAVAVGQTDQLAAPSIVKSPYYPSLEGGKRGDATFDSTAAINAAIVYATTQGRILKIDGVYYTGAGTGGVKLQSFCMLEGNGYGSGLAVIAGAAAGDHVGYYDTATTIGTTVMNLGLDGRKTHGVTNIVRGLANFATTGTATLGHPGHRYDSIYIRNYTGVGQSVGFAQRSSLFTNFTIYACDSYGLNDSSADCILSNYDIGSCWADANAASNPAGYICSAPGGQRSNFKVWGTGQYGGTLAVPGIFVRNATDISFTNIWTQESGGPGLSIFGSGQTVPGMSFINFASDGDGIVANQAAIVLNNSEGLHLVGRAGKWGSTLLGTPQDAISIVGNVKNSFIRLHAKGYSRRSLTIASGAVANDIDINGNTRGTLDHTYATSFTPEWYDAATHTMTLTGTTAVGAPTQSPDGAVLSFDFLNGAGAAAPTWNAAFLAPPNWSSSFVTTSAKHNIATFKRSDALGKWVAQSATYGI